MEQKFNNIIAEVASATYNYYETHRKRRAIAATSTILLELSKKREYTRKKYAVAPIFRGRKTDGFYSKVLPKLVLEDLRFFNYFRMSATQLENLLLLVGKDLIKQNFIREPIGVAERVMLTLRYLASGDSIRSMSYQYLVGVPTGGNIIAETCKALWTNLMPMVLNVDVSHSSWKKKADEFFDQWNFPNCVGAIDGKHIVIQSPPSSGSSYYNYKGTYSIVLLAICDAKYLFSFIDIGAYGRRSDGGIFSESEMGMKFNNDEMNLPPARSVGDSIENLPFCIVGDEAFPLKSYLMRPYPGNQSVDHDKRVFNYRLGRARRVIENTFGILSARWRIFRRSINTSVGNAVLTVQATVCLHNWLRMADIEEDRNQYVPTSMMDNEINTGFTDGSWRNESDEYNALQDLPRGRGTATAKEGVHAREKFTKFFINEGALEWQEKYL